MFRAANAKCDEFAELFFAKNVEELRSKIFSTNTDVWALCTACFKGVVQCYSLF